MSVSRVLVVDDSLTIRRALELILKPLGYELDFAADGAQALERATAFNPDLILLDYVLPDMRAPDVCAALAATPATAFTPIVLVSAKGASIRQAYQDAQNVVSYITKPFKPQVVASVVENALVRGRTTTSPARETTGVIAPRARVIAPEAEDSHRARSAEAAASAPPANVEQAFAALLAQLEGAVSEDAAIRGARAAPRGASFPGVSPRLRHAADRLSDIAEHLNGESVLPYRLRADGSFANIAATLLEAHRFLCEAAILLAATGAPSAALPRPPDILVVCPAQHALREEIEAEVRTHDLVPVTIDEDYSQLPHLVRLLAPRVVVAVPAAHPEADHAIALTLALEGRETSVIAFVQPGNDAGEIDHRYASRVEDRESLAAVLAGIHRVVPGEAPATPDFDLEVVAV